MRIPAVLLACAIALQAQPKPESIHWDESAGALAERRVLVVLSSGEKLEGSWVGVTANAFTMKTPKGLRTTPRTELSSIRAGTKHIRGRVLGGVIGFYGVAGIAAAATRKADGLQSGWAAAVPGGAVAGYFAGRALDNATHEVLLAP